MRSSFTRCLCRKSSYISYDRQYNSFNPCSIFGGNGFFAYSKHPTFFPRFNFSNFYNCCCKFNNFAKSFWCGLGVQIGQMLGVVGFNYFFNRNQAKPLQNGTYVNNQNNEKVLNEVKNNTEEKKLIINCDTSLDSKIRNEIIHIGKDALKKYLNKGSFTYKDLLIERVPAKITKVDFSNVFNKKSGVANDKKNELGDIIRVADGTQIKLKFKYNDKEYECTIKTNEIPKNQMPVEFVEKIT